MKILNQLEFSTLLFDTIFGLILFYSFDSLLGVKSLTVLVFYLFSMFILVHWWLIFKSTDDSFSDEVTDSAADIVFGIIYTIILYYLIQYSRSSDPAIATLYLIGVFVLDLAWSLIWRYVGEWRTKDPERIQKMESVLDKGIVLDIVFAACFCLMYVLRTAFSGWWFIGLYAGLYLVFMGLTFKLKTLDIDIF